MPDNDTQVKNTTTPTSAQSGASADYLSDINREFQEKSALRHAQELKLPYVDIAKTPLNPDLIKIVDLETMQKGHLVAFFKVGTKLRVAVSDPIDPETKTILENLQKKDFEVEVNLASTSGIEEALRTLDQSQQYKKIKLTTSVEERSIKTYEKEIKILSDLASKLDTVPAEEGVNLLDIGAMKAGASDAHYEPETDKVVLRFRIDGILHKVLEIKPETYHNLLNQIKYKSKIRLNVTSVPQDGRYDFSYNDRQIDVRVSTIPTPYSESIVCRYLISSGQNITFEELGFEGLALERLKKATGISHGMILTTGPTGSGKTTTLYSILNVLNSTENKIITLEDPVEYHVEGVTQSQIDDKRGYSFASGLRSVLRHDPDVVMIGEIRDLETAEVAAQAALTGHILLSSLHTNSAIETISRLLSMGLPAFIMAPSLHIVIGQRLVRKVCPKCSTLEPLTESEKDDFKKVFEGLKMTIPEKIPHTHGCDFCSQTGYKGRMVIAEAVYMSDKIKDLILNKASNAELFAQAKAEGMITMQEDGLIKTAKGLTTLEEVYRATNF